MRDYDQKPTLSTVAAAAGVSVPTVSQVLRGTGRISEQTRERVLQAARDLHYVQDSRAAAMRSGENCEIGFVINQMGNPFNAEVISGVVERLESEGYLLSVFDGRDEPERQEDQLQTFIRHGRGGLLWVPAMGTSDRIIRLLAAQRVPTVTFLRQLDAAFDHVGIRNAEATTQATQHLVSLGHRHFAYLGGMDMTAVRKGRIAGFQTTLKAAGLPEGLVWASDDNKRAGLDATMDLLDRHPDVTAIVCNGDMVALGACLALIRRGKEPGRDVSVIGFDDTEDAAVATPELTTMSVLPKKLGIALAEALLNRIRNPGTAPNHIELSAQLVVRQTTAKAPS